MTLLTLVDAKLQLNIDAADTSLDTELQAYVDAAVSVVERHVGEAVDVRAFTEQRVGGVRWSLVLSWPPVVSLTSVTSLDGTRTWDVTDLHVGSAGVARVLSGDPFDGDLEVVYQAGYSTPPANYNLAGRIIVQHLWQTQRGGTGPRVGGLDDSFQNAVGGGRGYAIPNAAVELLGESPVAFA